MMCLILLNLMFLSNNYLVSCSIVQTDTGPVKGNLNEFRGMKYYSYEGIPFAEPPIGDLRFKPPVPIRPWKHVLNATAPGPVCPQLEHLHVRSEMDENCLFLNVYVPANVSEPLPVFFYIHGGYYAFGSGNPTPVYGPQLILERKVILVTTNYRLGALGFLSLGIADATGNAGIKDILVALQWLNNNVAVFGGDSKSICLMGDNAGASLIHYLLLTNKTTNMFHSAVILSGSALSYRAQQTDGVGNAIKLARQLGIRTTNPEKLLTKLKEIDAFSIVDAQEYIVRNDNRRAFVLRDFFSPVVEKPSDTAIITRNPLDIIKAEGLVQKLPITTGFSNQEGLEIFYVLKRDPESINILNENYELCIPPNINYPYGSVMRKNLANSIREFYFDNLNITIFNSQNYINLISDTSYTYSIDYWIHLYKKHESSAPVYYYYLKFDGQLNSAKLLEGISYPGSAHGDGLGYFFVTNVTVDKLQTIDSKNQEILETLIHVDRNLAVYGNPTPAQDKGLQWLETDINGGHLEIDETPKNVNERPIPERLAFWYKVYDEYHEYERSFNL